MDDRNRPFDMDIPPSRNGAARAGRVLIVEGDSVSAETLRARLSDEGFDVSMPAVDEDLPAAIDRSDPDLVLLDWDLPGVVTFELMRHVGIITNQRHSVRVMALSTFSGEQRIVDGLEQGLDDYVVRPYSTPELLARVRALLRLGQPSEVDTEVLEFQGLRLDLANVRATLYDQRIRLRATEFRLLECLMRHPERAFSREQLLLHAWGRGSTAEVRAVDVTVQRVRQSLAPHHWSGEVQTVRGFGYRLSAQPAATSSD